MAKIVTLGEIMLRLSTPGFQRFLQSDSFDVTYGGGEANVACALSLFGHDTYFVSKVPDNEIGQSAINHLRRFGVNTSYVKRGGDRLGIYFLETGASMRPSKVIYDRADSAASNATVSDFDFDEIFKDANWFHWTGITPALGKKAQEVLITALKKAKENNVTVSVDLNFRKKLWTAKQAQEVMIPLMDYVDVCIGNEEDAEKTLGFKPENTDIEKGELSIEGFEKTLKKLKEKFGFKLVVSTLRESYSASDNGWQGIMFDGTIYISKHYDIRLVDRVGGGDSFASGLINGILKYGYSQNALEFAVAASCLKQTIPGDFNLVSEDEVENLKNGDASGRVQR